MKGGAADSDVDGKDIDAFGYALGVHESDTPTGSTVSVIETCDGRSAADSREGEKRAERRKVAC